MKSRDRSGTSAVTAINSVNNYLQSIGVADGSKMKTIVNRFAIENMGLAPEVKHKTACKHIYQRFYNSFKAWAELNYKDNG